jgi:hypothetical protein
MLSANAEAFSRRIVIYPADQPSVITSQSHFRESACRILPFEILRKKVRNISNYQIGCRQADAK